MAKNRSPRNENQASVGKSLTVEVPLPVLGALSETRKAFHALCIRTGEAGVAGDDGGGPGGVVWCEGPASGEPAVLARGEHREPGDAWGERLRLRVRSCEGEVALASVQWAASTDAMGTHTMAAVAAGVSTRDSPKRLDPLPEAMGEHGTSRSALSRKQMGEFMSRPLAELDIAAVFIDAKSLHEHCVLIALGVDSQGTNHVLGLREGSTENTAVTRALLADRVERGLPTERSVLFVIDGAKALRRAIADVYGERAVVQRCQVHKVREGLTETLTVVHLGLTGALQRPVRSTNAIENLNGSVERYTRNVKRWRGGEMIQRCSAGCRTAFPTGARLARHVASDERLGTPFDPLQSTAEGRVESQIQELATIKVQQRTGHPRYELQYHLESGPERIDIDECSA